MVIHSTTASVLEANPQETPKPLPASDTPVVQFPQPNSVASGPHIEGKNSKNKKGKKKNTKALKTKGRPASHGKSGTPEYASFHAAKSRCTNPNHRQYKDYGGRGIKFLFDSFEDFYEALGPRPKGMSVDRIDPDGHYEKGNVRWATSKQQAKNRRSSKKHKAEAAQKRTIRQQAARLQNNQLSRLWVLTIRYHNEGELTPLEQAEWEQMVSQLPFDIPKPDHPCQREGHILLPSLTRPGETIGVKFRRKRRHPEYGLGNTGLLDAVCTTRPAMNVSRDLLDLLIRCVDGQDLFSRFLWFTPPSSMGSKYPAIEGCLLSFASYCAGCFVVSDDVYPEGTFQTAHELAGLAATNRLDRVPGRLLIVPDLQVGLDPEGVIPHDLTYDIHRVLTERVQRQCPTIVFVENPQLLGDRIATLLEFAFRKVPLDLLSPLPGDELDDAPQGDELPDLSEQL
jgi:hypothetical protein